MAEQALAFAQRAPLAEPALVNGSAGLIVASRGRLLSVVGFTVTRGKIAEINVLTDPERLDQLDLAVRDHRTG